MGCMVIFLIHWYLSSPNQQSQLSPRNIKPNMLQRSLCDPLVSFRWVPGQINTPPKIRHLQFYFQIIFQISMLRQGSLGTISQAPRLHSQITPRFNLNHCPPRTYNPHYSNSSLSYQSSSKALTTPEHLQTLPSSTTSFGRMKSDKSIIYRQLDSDNKENTRSENSSNYCRYPPSSTQTVRNVDQIQEEFRKIISEFEDRKMELEKNFTGPFEVRSQQKIDLRFQAKDSCYVIKEEEQNTQLAEESYQKYSPYLPSAITQDREESQNDSQDLWKKYCSIKSLNSKTNSLTSTFGNTEWRKSLNPSLSTSANSSYSNTQFPFFIIDLKLPDKNEQLMYVPSVPVPQFASHIAQKYSLDPSHIPYICGLIQTHLANTSASIN